MNLSKKLSELVKSYMSQPGHVPDVPQEADFVMSGLRAAGSANMHARKDILSDVSDVLNCKAEDLEFLFSEFDVLPNAAAYCDVMVPDYRTRLLAAAE